MMVHMAATSESLRPMREAQIARDEMMASVFSEFLRSDAGKGRTGVLILGGGHIEYGLGTVARLRSRLPEVKDRIVVFSESAEVGGANQIALAIVREAVTRHPDLRVAVVLCRGGPLEEEFARHARDVAAAFGAGLSMRRGIFLGDADALFVARNMIAFAKAHGAVKHISLQPVGLRTAKFEIVGDEAWSRGRFLLSENLDSIHVERIRTLREVDKSGSATCGVHHRVVPMLLTTNRVQFGIPVYFTKGGKFNGNVGRENSGESQQQERGQSW